MDAMGGTYISMLRMPINKEHTRSGNGEGKPRCQVFLLLLRPLLLRKTASLKRVKTPGREQPRNCGRLLRDSPPPPHSPCSFLVSCSAGELIRTTAPRAASSISSVWSSPIASLRCARDQVLDVILQVWWSRVDVLMGVFSS